MWNEYTEFITKFNVLGLAVGLMIGDNLKQVANDFIDDILMPFVYPILKLVSNDGRRNMRLRIPGTKISLKLKRVISAIIKFACLSVIIFSLLQFGIKLKKPITWVSVRNFKEMRKTLS